MSKDEWLETAFLFVCIGLLWFLILGCQGAFIRVILYASIAVLLWIAWRRWRRFSEALKEYRQEKDETFGPLPPRLRGGGR